MKEPRKRFRNSAAGSTTGGKEGTAAPFDRICFVISPIGREGTDHYQTFKDTLEFVIRPAIRASGYRLEVVRADDIHRAGSFIKDILEYVSSAFVVIADLTGQNPNVFYELGVRHALSSRTILIAQTVDDIPSDLREYRTVVYDTSARGAAIFTERVKKYLEEMHEQPDRPDNPVKDRLGGILEERSRALEEEVASLRAQLEAVLRKGSKSNDTAVTESISTRLSRILTIKRAAYHFSSSFYVAGPGSKIQIPYKVGAFQLYKVPAGERFTPWYVASAVKSADFELHLADVRVLMAECSQPKIPSCTFLLAFDESLRAKREAISTAFEKMKLFVDEQYRDYFSLLLWDRDAVYAIEKELGIRVEL